MAARTVSNTGGLWSATATWVGGVVPLVGDTVNFTATSGNLVVNVGTVILAGIDFTNYVNTITFNNIIQLNGSLNLGTGGYTQAGTSGLWLLGNTIISGTTVWTRTFTVSALSAITLTLSNNLNLTDLSLTNNGGSLSFILGGNVVSISNNISFFGNGSFTLNIPHDLQITNLLLGANNARTCVINGLFTLSISGNLTQNQQTSITSGTASILLNGTGTWSNASTGALRNNLTINTAGTITISGTVYYNTGILTYTSGTVITTGSTLAIATAGTLNCGNMDDIITNKWNNIVFFSGTYVLTSNLNCQNFTGGGGGVQIDNSGGDIFISGNLLHNIGGAIFGTSSINLIGTGTWTDSTTSDIRSNLNINTSGTITIVGSIKYSAGILTYISGTVITTDSTLSIGLGGVVTLNTDGINWNNIIIALATTTLLSNLNCQNFTAGSGVANTINNSGGDVFIFGNLLHTSVGLILGTASINLVGTGTWTDGTGNSIRNDININTTGTITIVGIVYYNTGTLTYISGKVITKGSTLNLTASATLINCHKINFNKVIILNGATIYMNEFFSGTINLVTNISSSSTIGNYFITFSGFEKISKFVDINNCTLSIPLQLLVTTNSPRNSTNKGIRYINQSPNGIAKNKPSINAPMTFGVSGLLSDPNMR